MKLAFTSETWAFRSCAGGIGMIVQADSACLYGPPLSYGAFDCKVPLSPGWVRLAARCRFYELSAPENAVTVMLSFHAGDGTPLRRQYADVKKDKGSSLLLFSRLFEVPEGVAYGVVTLALRWPGDGSAVFFAPELFDAKPPAQRMGRVVVTHFCPRPGDIPSRVKSLFDDIRVCSPDLICLSEALFTRNAPPGSLRGAAEKVGGEVTSLMSELAAKHGAYVAGNFLEADGDLVFNTSALFDRSGSLTGTYRKVHLPLAEVEYGTAPGGEYPVFSTDFARIGMMICWDAAFPETARCLRLNGAELIVNARAGDFGKTDGARAVENGLWYAIAGTDHL
ncbi:MAG: carbon-nitrogen hydrolase family protein, partial [Clostridia bacterium]|nr:carbon-nitrogen hydrolase family protein [Clostridia bacterium]